VQTLEREQNERDVLEALGDYKCDAGMSVENVPAVVKITLNRRFVAHTKTEQGRLRGRQVLLAVVKE
jgi:hypothetical protein